MALKIDPIVKSKRVFKNKADAALQDKLEGSNSDFQVALRHAEKTGLKTFKWTNPKTGKTNEYAARTTATPEIKGPPTKRATRPPGQMTPPTGNPNIVPRIQTFPTRNPVDTLLDEGETTGKYKEDKSFKRINQSVNARKVKNISPTGTNKRGGGRNAKKRGLVN